MNITLINPQYSNKDYIPLGILILKGYLTGKQNITGRLNIKVIDLNIKYFDYGFLVQKSKSYCASCRRNKRCSKKHYFPKEITSLIDKVGYCEAIAFRDFLLNNNDLTIKWQTKEILSNNPIVVGFSIFNSFNIGNPVCSGQLLSSLVLAKAIKKINCNIKIIFGGASFYSNNQNFELMHFFPDIDIIVKGEGEIPLLSIIKQIKNNNYNFRNVPNIIWRRENSIFQNRIIDFKKYEYSIPDYSGVDLDSYISLPTRVKSISAFLKAQSPLNRNVIRPQENSGVFVKSDKNSYKQAILPLKLSSGCYWAKCKFCSFYRFSSYKRKATKNIVSEMSYYLKGLGINTFHITDEAMHPDVFSCFADIIKKNNWNLSYRALARPTKHFTKKLLLKLYNSGCKVILWGVETFSQNLLNRISKGLYVNDIAVVLKNAYDVGICNFVFYIYCFPTQTLRDIEYDYDFLRKHIEYITVLLHQPFRLDRESLFYEHLYYRDKRLLIPIFRKGRDCVNSLLCKYLLNKEIMEYFNDIILPYIWKNTINLTEGQLLELLHKNNELNSQNIKRFVELLG